MTHAYSIDASSSDDTDWILLDFEEPAAKSGKVRDTNVRDIRAAPLSRKPAKKSESEKTASGNRKHISKHCGKSRKVEDRKQKEAAENTQPELKAKPENKGLILWPLSFPRQGR